MLSSGMYASKERLPFGDRIRVRIVGKVTWIGLIAVRVIA